MAHLDRHRFVLLDRTRKRYLDLASLWDVSNWQARQLSAQHAEPLFDGLALSRVLRTLRAAIATIEPRADERLQEWAERWAAAHELPPGRETFVRVLLEPRFTRDCRSLIAWRCAAARPEKAHALRSVEQQNPDFLRRFGLHAARSPSPAVSFAHREGERTNAAPAKECTGRGENDEVAAADGCSGVVAAAFAQRDQRATPLSPWQGERGWRDRGPSSTRSGPRW